MRYVVSLIALSLTASGCTMVPASQQTSGGRGGTQSASWENVERAPSPRVRRAGGMGFGSGAGGNSCLAELGSKGSRFTAMPDRDYGAGCSTVNTVQLASLGGDAGEFGLSNAGPITCNTARAMAGWARFGVDRAARQILGSPLVRIETMGTYSCRNVAGSSRRSAHSTANAVDVSGFVLADGRRISVKGDWDGGSAAERKFLRTVQDSACKRFGTVLGPRYNAAHADHFHLEVKRGGGSFCR